MKKTYKKKAWLIDEDIILDGYVVKRKFIPNNKGCGFSYQKINKKDIGKILFYDKQDALRRISKMKT